MTLTSDLHAELPRYPNTEHLYGTMYSFGNYRLSYLPPEEGYIDPSIEMSISSEADLTEMLKFFTSFLKAAGYPLEQNEQLSVTNEEVNTWDNPLKTTPSLDFNLSNIKWWTPNISGQE